MEILIEKLCDRWGLKGPEGAMVKAVNSTFPELNEIDPPVDINKLAFSRGVQEIKLVTMPTDGVISLLKEGKYLIELNKTHSIPRRRFTCGHEIGHTFFFELERETGVTPRVRIEDNNIENLIPNQSEEYLCNLASAEMLMPRNVFLSQLSSLGLSSNTIRSLANRFKTSLLSTARRAIELSPTKLIIGLWRYQESLNYYSTRWLVSKSRILYGEKILIDKSIPLFRTFQTLSEFRGRQFISLGGPLDDYFVDYITLPNLNMKLILSVFILDPSIG